MDVSLLYPAMIAGAAAVSDKVGEIVGTEIVKEVTKDAYRALKSVLIGVCGKAAGRAADKVEADPTSKMAKAELASAITDIPQEDREEVLAALSALLLELRGDRAAQMAAETRGQIKLDIDSGGHVRLARISGATLDVRSLSKGDFSLEDVDVAGDRSLGN